MQTHVCRTQEEAEMKETSSNGDMAMTGLKGQSKPALTKIGANLKQIIRNTMF